MKSWLTKFWKNAIVIEKSVIFFDNYRFEFFYHDWIWRWYIFRCFLDGRFSDCVPSVRNLMVGKFNRSICCPNFVDLQTHFTLKLPAWFILTRSPSRLSCQYPVSFWKWFGVCSINIFCTPLTENIAVRLRLLLSQCDCASCFKLERNKRI